MLKLESPNGTLESTRSQTCWQGAREHRVCELRLDSEGAHNMECCKSKRACYGGGLDMKSQTLDARRGGRITGAPQSLLHTNNVSIPRSPSGPGRITLVPSTFQPAPVRAVCLTTAVLTPRVCGRGVRAAVHDSVSGGSGGSGDEFRR